MENKIFIFFLIFHLAVPARTQILDTSQLIKHIDSLIDISSKLRREKKFEAAVQVINVVKNMTENTIGNKNLTYIKYLKEHGNIINQNYLLDRNVAGHYYVEALKIQEELLGENHTDNLVTINKLGQYYQSCGKYSDAEKQFLKAKNLSKYIYGDKHTEYASAVCLLANLYRVMGKYQLSYGLFNEGTNIFGTSFEINAKNYYTALSDFGYLNWLMERFDTAAMLCMRAIRIMESNLPIDTIVYASTVSHLGLIYMSLRQYELSEQYILESLFLRRKYYGNIHPNCAVSLNNLGILYQEMGFYEKAEKQHQEAYFIREKTIGPTHNQYATTLDNLASLYLKMGLYKKCEHLLAKALDIRERTVGKEHTEYASSLINLAELYKKQKYYEKAEKLLLTVNVIHEKLFGNQSLKYADGLRGLSSLYYSMREYEKSESNLLNARMIYKLKSDSCKLCVLYGLNDLAKIKIIKGNLVEAKELIESDIKIQDELAISETAEYFNDLMLLFQILMSLNQKQDAITYLLKAIELERNLLYRASAHFSQLDIVNYLSNISNTYDYLGSLSFKLKDLSAHWYREYFNSTLINKGFFLQSSIIANRIANNSKDSTLQLYNLWKSYHRLLSDNYSNPIKNISRIEKLEAETDSIEKILIQSLIGFSEARKVATWKIVQDQLLPDEVAIEFVKFQCFNNDVTDSIMYAALLVNKNLIKPLFIPLFEEKSLISLLGKECESKSDFLNLLYTYVDKRSSSMDKPQKSLYELIWAPLEQKLQGVKKIYFSPSGLLHRINLNAIPISEMVTVGDRYHLIALNSTRQLAVPDMVQEYNHDVVLFGGIDYELDSNTMASIPLIASRYTEELSIDCMDSTLRGGSWKYLPGTEREIQAIVEVLKTESYNTQIKRGRSATEESFKQIGQNGRSPSVLHLSTHGYFFPDRTISAIGRMSHESVKSEENAKAASSKPQFIENEEPVFKISEHPMLRSGLILAGGNAGWKGMKTLEGREDGVLTAYEISQMNLSNTELVVLSACETGLGDIKGNEGVYGLQRAFKIAGAKYLIMSLWQVPDRETKEFMVSFYKNWLTKKNSIPDAFRKTQKEMRERFINPYAWAGFVLVE